MDLLMLKGVCRLHKSVEFVYTSSRPHPSSICSFEVLLVTSPEGRVAVQPRGAPGDRTSLLSLVILLPILQVNMRVLELIVLDLNCSCPTLSHHYPQACYSTRHRINEMLVISVAEISKKIYCSIN